MITPENENPFASPPEFDLQKNPIDPMEIQRQLLYGTVLKWEFVRYSVFCIASKEDMIELEDIYTKCMNTKKEDIEGYSFFSEKLVTADMAPGDRIIVKWGKWEDLTKKKKEETDEKTS